MRIIVQDLTYLLGLFFETFWISNHFDHLLVNFILGFGKAASQQKNNALLT